MVYEDVQFCYEGVNYLAEDLDLQVGSKSAIVLKTENNNDVVTQNALNFNIPSAHKTGVKTSGAHRLTAIRSVTSSPGRKPSRKKDSAVPCTLSWNKRLSTNC